MLPILAFSTNQTAENSHKLGVFREEKYVLLSRHFQSYFQLSKVDNLADISVASSALRSCKEAVNAR